MDKKEFKLECACGCQTFYAGHGLESDTLELRCEDCGEPIAHVRSYAINWVTHEEEADADSND